MAHDDMHVVMYKILSYLYKCMKAGEDPDLEMISAAYLGINQRYHGQIVMELIERGFVKGYRVTKAPGATSVMAEHPYITMSGVEFLMENSMMSKALDFLRSAKDTIPFV